MTAYAALAPAKVNLGLFLGPTRPGDGRHELVTVMQSISLADELTLEPAPAGAREDELVCPGVSGPAHENLAARALRAFREATGWDSPPLRLTVAKRIPIAAGLAGGSADAAATLRLAAHASGLADRDLLQRLAAQLGADVPAQVQPGRWLAGGAGELLQALPDPDPPLALLVLPLAEQLSTAAVYGEADRLALGRTSEDLAGRRAALAAALARGIALPATAELVNDLQAPAISLYPQIEGELTQARRTGADAALVSGSGPTVLALFAPDDGSATDALALARRAAEALAGRAPPPICATSVSASFGAVAARHAGASQSWREHG